MESSKVQFAAGRAAKSSLGIFLTAVITVPFISVVHRIFGGSWEVNWRLAFAFAGILAGCFFLFFFITQLLEISRERGQERSHRLAFPAAMWLRGLYLFTIVMGVAIMNGTYREGDSWWVVTLPAVFVLLGFFAWPKAIQINATEIRQRGPFLNLKKIALNEVESIYFDAGRGEIAVYGRNGQRIVHSMMHVDGKRFMEQMESHTGKTVTLPGLE